MTKNAKLRFTSQMFQGMDDFSHYKYSVFQTKNIVDLFFLDNIEIFREVVSTWEGCDEYLEKLEHLKENLSEIGSSCYVANHPQRGYNVLNHGDFHLRNILVKTDKQNRWDRFNFVSL